MGGVGRQWRKLHPQFDQYTVWCYPRQRSRCQCAKCCLFMLRGHVFPKSLNLDEKRISKYIYVVQKLGKNFQKDNRYALSSACCLVFPGGEATSKWNVVRLHIFIYISELVREQFSKSKGRLQPFSSADLLMFLFQSRTQILFLLYIKKKKKLKNCKTFLACQMSIWRIWKLLHIVLFG